MENKRANLPVLTDTDLSYLSGLFDGEGSAGVYISPSSKSRSGKWYAYPKPVIQLKMTDRDPVYFFTLCLPGSCSVEYTPTQRKMGWKPSWKFLATCRNAEFIARLLLPHVKNPSKIRQLESVLQHYKERGTQ